MHQHQNASPKISLLQKITNFIMGFLLGLMMFMICLKLLSSMWGALLGISVGIIASAYALKTFKNDPPKKIVATGILASVVVIIAIYLLISALIFLLFQGISA